MKKLLWDSLAVGGMGFIAAILRFLISRWLNAPSFAPMLPLGTLLINISGSFILGWFMTTVMEKKTAATETLIFAVAIGFIGSFTTFSSLMRESHDILGDKSYWMGFGYLIGSIVLGLVAFRLGVILAHR